MCIEYWNISGHTQIVLSSSDPVLLVQDELKHSKISILKLSRDLYTKKETICGLFIVNTWLHYFYLTWKRS